MESEYAGFEMDRLQNVDDGEGNPSVMVHGTPSWSFEYRRLIQGLSKR